jgi:hypothetical protein
MAVEIFEQTVDGTLVDALKKFVTGKKKAGPPKPGELELIRRMTDLAEVRKKAEALHVEAETLAKRVKEREESGKDPVLSNSDGARANHIARVLNPALRKRMAELEREIAHDVRMAARSKELAENPVLAALDAAHKKHDAIQRAHSKLWVKIRMGTKDERGNLVEPPLREGSDARALAEIELADLLTAKLRAVVELKAAVEARRIQMIEDKANRGALAMKEWREVALDAADAAESFLEAHERLERLMPRLTSGGQSIPIAPRVALETLKLYIARTEAEVEKYDEGQERKAKAAKKGSPAKG